MQFSRIAYAYTTRHLMTSPLSSMSPNDSDVPEARSILGRLVPFLVDKGSKTRFSSLKAVVTDIWSRFEPVRRVLGCLMS